MVNYILRLIGISCWLSMLSPQISIAQEPLKLKTMEEEFEEGMMLLNSFQNDKANIKFTLLMQALEGAGELETHFGYKVRLRQAEALEKDHQDEEAVKKLLVIAKGSERNQYWDVYTNANLSLARLYEKLEQEERCLDYLRVAEQSIKAYQLDPIYPRFYNRIASYHRIFGSQDSALYYAQEAIQTARALQQKEEEAVGHLITGLVWRDVIPERAIPHFRFAGNRWSRVGDYSGHGAILTNLSKVYLQSGQANLALQYSDSAIIAFQFALFEGNVSRHVFHHSYKHRSEIFEALGQLDSALHYSKIAAQMQLEALSVDNNNKIIEIQERYDDEQKTLQLEEQSAIIAYGRARRKMLIGVILLTFLFATILAYYYVRLRKVNQRIVDQAEVISKTNEKLSDSLEKQIILQGEVHHRVKNNLQIIISLLELQSEDIEDVNTIASLKSMSNRIYSMAAIHEMLYQKQDAALINLLEYTQNLCKHFSNFLYQKNAPVFHISMDNHYFNIETLMPLGMILNELLTNSMKYAAHLERQLRISIQLERRSDHYQLIYRDNGPGFPSGVLQGREGGLGTYLLNSMSRQLNGKLTSRNDDGAVYEIFFKEKNRTILRE